MATMTYGGGRGIHSVHRVWPHQAKLVLKISDARVLVSLTNSQTCSWSQQDHLNLIITSLIQFEILECIYEVEVTRLVIYAEPRLETAFHIDEVRYCPCETRFALQQSLPGPTKYHRLGEGFHRR